MGSLIQPKKRRGNPSLLSPQQRMFVVELIADRQFCPTRAARAAGYKVPSVAADKLIKQPQIRAEIGKALHDRLVRCEITADSVLTHLVTALYLDPLTCFNTDGTIKELDQIPEEVRRCIKKLKVKTHTTEDGETTTNIELEFMDKDTCMSLAMKHLGMLNEKLEVKHEVSSDLMAQLLTQVEANRKVMNQELLENTVEGSVVRENSSS